MSTSSCLAAALTVSLAFASIASAAPQPAQPLFSRRDINIDVAPEANMLTLGHNPSPDVLSSPVRKRIADQKAAAAGRRMARKSNSKRSGTSTGKAAGGATGSASKATALPAVAKKLQDVHTIYSGVYPTVNLTWGNKKGVKGAEQQFISFIDTGSADTWVATSDLECVDLETYAPVAQSKCGFGQRYDTKKGDFTNLTDQAFEIDYAPENQKLKGSMATARVSLAGIEVPDQHVALVDYAAWEGDGHSSGLLGLAYPPLTSASDRTDESAVVYDPLFTSMAKKGLVKDAVFTLAIDRVPQKTSATTPAGKIALGGLLPESYYEAPFTSVPIEVHKASGESELTWYTTTSELVYKKKDGTQVSGGKYQSIVDCGTAPNLIPSKAAKDLNAQFVPPAKYDDTLGYWTVDCNAKAPYAAFVIGGVEMPMDPKDMIVRSLNGKPGFESTCFSAFGDGGDPKSDFMVIGSVWQRGRVIAYDQGRSMLHFAKRSASASA